jgi:hypothetical protein
MPGTACASSTTTTSGSFETGKPRHRSTSSPGSRRSSDRCLGSEKSSQIAALGISLRDSVDFPVCRAPNIICT